jgi:hypothetical protein
VRAQRAARARCLHDRVVGAALGQPRWPLCVQSMLRRGARERYSGSTLAAAVEPWELELAKTMEERFATIRLVADNVSRFRMAVRQHAKLVRQITEQAVRKTLTNVHSEQSATFLVKAYMTCISSSR